MWGVGVGAGASAGRRGGVRPVGCRVGVFVGEGSGCKQLGMFCIGGSRVHLGQAVCA